MYQQTNNERNGKERNDCYHAFLLRAVFCCSSSFLMLIHAALVLLTIYDDLNTPPSFTPVNLFIPVDGCFPHFFFFLQCCSEPSLAQSQAEMQRCGHFAPTTVTLCLPHPFPGSPISPPHIQATLSGLHLFAPAV